MLWEDCVRFIEHIRTARESQQFPPNGRASLDRLKIEIAKNDRLKSKYRTQNEHFFCCYY